MSFSPDEHLYVSIYKFKCNIAYYLRRLHAKNSPHKAIILKHYKKSVALIMPIPEEMNGGYRGRKRL